MRLSTSRTSLECCGWLIASLVVGTKKDACTAASSESMGYMPAHMPKYVQARTTSRRLMKMKTCILAAKCQLRHSSIAFSAPAASVFLAGAPHGGHGARAAGAWASAKACLLSVGRSVGRSFTVRHARSAENPKLVPCRVDPSNYTLQTGVHRFPTRGSRLPPLAWPPPAAARVPAAAGAHTHVCRPCYRLRRRQCVCVGSVRQGAAVCGSEVGVAAGPCCGARYARSICITYRRRRRRRGALLPVAWTSRMRAGAATN